MSTLTDVWPWHQQYAEAVESACESAGHVPGEWFVQDARDPGQGAWLLWRGLEPDRSPLVLAARDGDPEALGIARAEQHAAAYRADGPSFDNDPAVGHWTGERGRRWLSDTAAVLLPPDGPAPAPGLDVETYVYGVALYWRPSGWAYAPLDAYGEPDPDDVEPLPLDPMAAPEVVARAARLVLAGQAEQVQAGGERWLHAPAPASTPAS